jgi:hypothetical protein
MHWNTIRKALVPFAAVVIVGCAANAPKPAKYVYFVEPQDGATVTSPVKVKFAVVGMELKPAGDDTANSGHHHILINLDAIPEGVTVPANDTNIHFGKAQTEAELKLAPGTYKLTMQYADKDHKSYGPALAKTITVTVK